MSRTTCGVLITDGKRVLLGHATRLPRWDIPKGLAEPGEDFRSAAVRELDEETGLTVSPELLRDLGVHRYLRGKDLSLFAWRVERLPEPTDLRCQAMLDIYVQVAEKSEHDIARVQAATAYLDRVLGKPVQTSVHVQSPIDPERAAMYANLPTEQLRQIKQWIEAAGGDVIYYRR